MSDIEWAPFGYNAPNCPLPYPESSMNPLHWSFRAVFALAALIAGAFLGYAYYAQFYQGLEPCPLCILQRLVFIGLFLVCLVAAIHNPARRGEKIYAALAAATALVGVAIAGRHVYLQHLPPDRVPACGPGLDFMLDAFPLSKTLKMVFTGSGECAKVDWTFIGLSMPEWTLIWFVIYALAASYFLFRRTA